MSYPRAERQSLLIFEMSNDDFYTKDPQYHHAGTPGVYQDEVSNFYIFQNSKSTSREQQVDLDRVDPYYSAIEGTTSDPEQLQTWEDGNDTAYLNNSETNENKLPGITSHESDNENELNENEQVPIAEALHSPKYVKGRLKEHHDVTKRHKKKEINKVSQEPVDKDSILENLTDIRFSWVDIIIAVCCTAAILLILINIGKYVCSSVHSIRLFSF